MGRICYLGQGLFTNKPWRKSRFVSETPSKSRCRSARWWLAPKLTFEYHNQTGICLTNIRNCCHRNKIYVLTRLLKQIHLQPALCTLIYCAVNLACHSCCHHHKFTSWRTHGIAMLLSWIRGDVTIVAIDSEWKNIRQTKQWRDMRLTSWPRSRLNRASMIFLCEYISNETQSGSKPILSQAWSQDW